MLYVIYLFGGEVRLSAYIYVKISVETHIYRMLYVIYLVGDRVRLFVAGGAPFSVWVREREHGAHVYVCRQIRC